MFFKKSKKGLSIEKDIAEKFEYIVYSVHLKVSEDLTERDRRYCILTTNVISQLILGYSFNSAVEIWFIRQFEDEYNKYFKPLKELLDEYGYSSLYK